MPDGEIVFNLCVQWFKMTQPKLAEFTANLLKRTSSTLARKWSNLNLPGALHFVTGNIIDRLPVFTRTEYCTTFFQVLDEVSHDWPCKLIAYVLMPDHVHFVCNPRDGRIKEFTGAVKSLSAKRICDLNGEEQFVRARPDTDGSTHQVWQESFKALPLWSGRMIWQKINYIHANPVKAGICKSAKDYQWSSFRVFYQGATEPLPVDRDWWWEDDGEKLTRAIKELGWRSWEKRD